MELFQLQLRLVLRISPLELELSPLAAHQTDGEICRFAFRCRTLEGWSVYQEDGVGRWAVRPVVSFLSG